MNIVAVMIVALAAIAKASPIFYTYPTYGTTVVRSDRLGGNFAYSINQGPAAIAQAFPGHVEIKAAPAYGFQFGYPSLYSPGHLGYPLAPLSFNHEPVPAPAATPASSSDENQAEIVEAAY